MSLNRTALGINITEKRIELVLLRKNKNGIKLLKSAEGFVPEGAVKNGSIENPAILAKAIKKLVSKNRMFASRASMALFANPVLMQILDIPEDTSGNIRQYIDNEVKHYAVLPIKKAALDFCKVRISAGTGSRRTLIVATDSRQVTTLVKELYKRGISIDSIEPAWISYTRSCYEKIISKNQNTNLLFVFIKSFSAKDALKNEHGILTLSLYKEKKLEFIRTKSIESEINDTNDSSLYSSGFINYMAEHINAVLKFYEYGISKQSEKWKVILLSDDNTGFNEKTQKTLKDILNPVSLEIKSHETKYLDTPIADTKMKNKPSGEAIGLAMKLLITTNNDLNINLVPSSTIIRKSQEKKTLITANIAAVLMVIMFLSIIFINHKIANVSAQINKQVKPQTQGQTVALVNERIELESQIKEISEKIENMGIIQNEDSTVNWAAILKDIGSSMPKQARLTNIYSTSQFGLVLNGQALTHDAMYEFVDALNECESIESAVYTNAQNNGQTNRLVNYSISCVIAK